MNLNNEYFHTPRIFDVYPLPPKAARGVGFRVNAAFTRMKSFTSK